MEKNSGDIKIVHVFRYDPNAGEKDRYDRFEVSVENNDLTTILDVLLRIQKEQDPTLSFRFACRVSMCGSCGMVINGRERLACKTVVSDLKEKEIFIRPLNHFPVIKDLIVDMEPFFEKYRQAMPFFEPAAETDEPAVIPPDSRERYDIGLSTECIACGCCVSSCTMAASHGDYIGPAGINRAFTLIADSRDGLREKRKDQVLHGCYTCRTEFNCTEVCPKEISPTRAIKYIQRQAFIEAFQKRTEKPALTETKFESISFEGVQDDSRRKFLKRVTYTLGAATAVLVGGVLVSSAVFPSLRKSPRLWVYAGQVGDFESNKVTTVNLRYQAKDGFYTSRKSLPVMITRKPGTDDIVVYSSRCTHLGCTVHWDDEKRLFLCACHGGIFNPDGSVKAGPPPEPLVRCNYKVENSALLVEVV